MMMNDKFLEDLKGLNNISFYQYNKYNAEIRDYAYDIPDGCKAIWMDDIEHIDTQVAYDRIMDNDLKGLIIVHEYTMFGDYGGNGSVAMSNHRILVDEYNHIDLYGGYGSHYAGCRIDRLVTDEDYKDQIFGIYENLERYPCIDDEDMSNLEYDLSKEVFEDCYKSDLIDAIGSKFEVDIDDYEVLPDTSLWDLLETLSERSNTYWENEYTSMYININACVESMTSDDFNQYFMKVME